jgi:hypothetical protein
MRAISLSPELDPTGRAVSNREEDQIVGSPRP